MAVALSERHVEADMPLNDVLSHLEGHGGKGLEFMYAGRTIEPGYHITEIKAGHFSTLDCGGNPDEWSEVVLQIEDLPAGGSPTAMSAGKFKSIIDRCRQSLPLDDAARLTIEIGKPGEAMMVHDIGEIHVEGSRLVIELVPRSAICKPRHRAAAGAALACCKPAPTGRSCCA